MTVPSSPAPPDVLVVLARPRVFTHTPPWTTSEVIKEAERRGFYLDPPTLRELYRRRYLTPLLELTRRAVNPSMPMAVETTIRSSTYVALQSESARGRIRDLTVGPYRPRLRFDTRDPSGTSEWRNGLLYSRWQLLRLHLLRSALADRKMAGTGVHRQVRMPVPDPWLTQRLAEADRWALVLTALEPRYLPLIRPDHVHLINLVDEDEWRVYRDGFNPEQAMIALGVTRAEVIARAQMDLLTARGIDPLGEWSRLVAHGHERSWRTLKNDALTALDHRIAAEILLLFAEDLPADDDAAGKDGEAAGLTGDVAGDLTGVDAPVIDENIDRPRTPMMVGGRLSDRDEPLDRTLARFGISPHPGAVLVVEGEVEEWILPKVLDRLRLSRTADIVGVVCMRGADKQLPLMAAALAAPILGSRYGDTYDMVRPPTHLVVAVDPDGNQWSTPEQTEKTRREMVAAITATARAQQADVDVDALDSLVEVYVWRESCFEFEHFTDDEIAEALWQIHPTCGMLSRSGLAAKVAETRARRADIKRVWDRSWRPEPSKPDLARVLWPVLAAKIDAAIADHTIEGPMVAQVAQHAWRLAQTATIGTFVIGVKVRDERDGAAVGASNTETDEGEDKA